ncbi:FAD-dependent oxidoreductase [Mycobacterium avium]|uniref:FAD-dependent oxidoreductase n=1 Tax=Mycobacterium avium TaxID=1764 RepID=UPI000A0314B5|nr:FAD-dependent oxidoreductase [Mycobacterium avium]
MAYVITQNCCKDESCVPVCPVDCIRPASGPGEFTGTEMLYIDPVTCIDCGACAEECPVDAIYFEEELPPGMERFREINATYFEHHPLQPEEKRHSAGYHRGIEPGSLRVAIVGGGPAACYAASELIHTDGVEVNLFERLPTPFGLIRSGVAPDHQHTKSVVDTFKHAFTDRRFHCYLNVEVGQHLSHEDLLAHHHAVIYAVGASKSRELSIPGEELPGNYGAAEFVGWYNGHPDHAHHDFDLSSERAVIVGNGNVALDVARILLMPAEELAKTDIADHALKALSESKIREVIILGRRGPRDGAFSVGEFLALGYLPGIDIVIDSDELEAGSEDGVETKLKLDIAREYAQRDSSPDNKRITFRFLTSPTEVVGDGRVEGLRVVHNTRNDTGGLVKGDPAQGTELINTSLILRSIGYRGAPIEGLPYDPTMGIVMNDRGRVLDDDDAALSGTYVTGWCKRGPRGVIGTNRMCAQETVAKLWEDYDEGRLSHDVKDRAGIDALLKQNGADPVGWQGWCAIDAAESEQGAQTSRPRVKFVDIADMLNVAQGANCAS